VQIPLGARQRARSRRRMAATALFLLVAAISVASLPGVTASAAPGAPHVIGTFSAGPATVRSLEAAPDVAAPPASAAAPFRPAMPADEFAAAKAAAAAAPAAPRPGAAATAVPAPAGVAARSRTFIGTGEATACGACATPDPSIAVGPKNVVEVVNSTVTVFNKSGAFQKRTSLAALSGYSAEPFRQGRVLYDPLWKRWFIYAVAEPESASVQTELLAASQTSDPRGNYYILMDNAAGDGGVVDYPMLGMDQDAVLFTFNVLDATTGAYTSSGAFGVGKVFLYNGLSFGVPVFGGLIGTLAPPIVLDGSSTDYFVAAPPGTNKTALKLYSFDGLGRTPTMKGPFSVTVPSYGIPRDAHQFNGPDLETGDARFLGPSTQVGSSLWNTHTVSANPPTPRFYEIDTSARTLKQTGKFYASASSDDWNATIVATAAGDAFVSWSSSDPVAFKPVEARFTGRASTDPTGAMQPSQALAITSGVRDTGTAPEPWGRWSGIAIDPSASGSCAAGKRAWVMNEAVQGDGSWLTAFGRIGLC